MTHTNISNASRFPLRTKLLHAVKRRIRKFFQGNRFFTPEVGPQQFSHLCLVQVFVEKYDRMKDNDKDHWPNAVF